ncbi:hypothetical protein ACOMHN_050890 [Nucella lapillus]
MKPGEETFGKASQMLRDILKNSKQEGAEDQVRDNNNTMKTLDTAPHLSPLNTACAASFNASSAASDSENLDSMSSTLPGKSPCVKAEPVEDNHIHSEHSSGDESDLDNSLRQTNDKDEAQKENDRERDEYCSPNSASPSSDSKEVKRARVENILTSIRQCSQTGCDSLSQITCSDMKRQKRKQPQPQQHEGKTSQASKAKYRKLERLVLHKHILQLQKQLQAVKKTFSEISRGSSDDEEKDVNGTHEDLENEEYLQETPVTTHSKEKDVIAPTGQRFSPPEETEHRSPPSLHMNGKVSRESSENTRYVFKDTDSHAHQNGHLSVPRFQPSLTSQYFSMSLKSEIIQAVKKAVDSAVITVLEKHAGPLTNHQQANLQTDSDIQQQREQQYLPSKSPKKDDESQQLLTVPKPRQEREALKETISNSQTERLTQLIIPFPDHLRILERLSHHRQLPEKQSIFEPLPPRSESSSSSSDLIKPHTNPTLPFPPFPYGGYLPAGLLPPLFPPPEPEQTEALPLVVSSSSKKKRTKVTDTRLTPGRGKSSPPETDQVPGVIEEGGGEERLPPLSSPFPHPYLPSVLPTSVAITNPSLHQSELFGAFGFHETAFEAPAAPSSPEGQDRDSDPTKSPPQDSGQGVGNSAPASPVVDGDTNKAMSDGRLIEL